MRRAKLPAELVQHDLRHRRVTTWIAAGEELVKVSQAVGHADIRTTMLYTHPVRDLTSLVTESESATVVQLLRDILANLRPPD